MLAGVSRSGVCGNHVGPQKEEDRARARRGIYGRRGATQTVARNRSRAGRQPRSARNSRHHRELFLRRGKVGLYTNWVEFIAHTDYDAHGRFGALPGEKAVFMNPRTRYEDIDRFVENLRGSAAPN